MKKEKYEKLLRICSCEFSIRKFSPLYSFHSFRTAIHDGKIIPLQCDVVNKTDFIYTNIFFLSAAVCLTASSCCVMARRNKHFLCKLPFFFIDKYPTTE